MKRFSLVLTVLVSFFVLLAGALPAQAIVGGKDSTEDYPFMGAYKPDQAASVPPGPGGNGCGVSLIAPQWALTAAHCLKNNYDQVGSPKGWKVQIASADVTSGGEVAEVERFFLLANPKGRPFGKDLMLLRLRAPVKAEPIQIASGTPLPGTSARILGWGDTCVAGEPGVRIPPECYPTRLQEGDVTVQEASVCPSSQTDGSELCVTSQQGVTKTGNADSGGPLLVREAGMWKLTGVLSGPDEANPEAAGLYTDVTKHTGWIKDIMNRFQEIPDDPAPDGAVSGLPSIPECAASVVRTTASSSEDPALLLTNGHCVGAVAQDRNFPNPAPGQALVDQPADARIPFLDKKGYLVTEARANRLIYATMTGTDIAIYRLDKSYAQLSQEGAKIFQLATAQAQAGDRFTLLSATFSVVMKCQVDAIVPTLREGGYELKNSLRESASSDCKPYPGLSGAPLVAPDGETVIGVHNTKNREGAQCTDDNPCEVNADGTTTAVKDRTYGQQVFAINGCFLAGSRLDLSRPGCALTGASAVTPTPTPAPQPDPTVSPSPTAAATAEGSETGQTSGGGSKDVNAGRVEAAPTDNAVGQSLARTGVELSGIFGAAVLSIIGGVLLVRWMRRRYS